MSRPVTSHQHQNQQRPQQQQQHHHQDNRDHGDTSLRTVLVIYNKNDGSKWPAYLKMLFDKCDRKVTLVSLKDEKLLSSPSASSASHYRPGVLVVLLTPEHLKFLRSNPAVDYQQASVATQRTFSPDNSCLVLLGLTDKDVREPDRAGQSMERRFESFQRWSRFEYSTVENILPAVSAMFAGIEREVSEGTTARGRIVYGTIKCNEEATVAIAFENELPPKALVHVYLNFPGNPENRPVASQVLNPYTVTFTTKERFEGEASVLVLVNGSEVRLLPSSQVRFVSSAGDVHANSQIYIKFIEMMLRRSLLKKNPIPEVDDALAKTFTPEEMMAVPSMAFEEFFGILVDVPNGSFRHPTILHLTAEFGLKELTSKLVDLPDSKLALQMTNDRNKLPEDIAREKGFLDLANFLESSRMTELDDLYINKMKMMNAFDTDDHQLKSQVRQIKAKAVSSDVYEDHIIEIKPPQSRRPSTTPPVPPKTPALQSPTKTKSFPRAPSQENGSEFYVQLENIMQKFTQGEMDMVQTEKAFNNMKTRLQHGCQTFQQKHESTMRLRSDLMRAKTNFMPAGGSISEEPVSCQTAPKESHKSSREFLIRKPTSFQMTSSDLPNSPPPPLPSRSSRTLPRSH